jgi:hypothetical protein
VFTEEGVDRRFYEFCVLSVLRDALRSGDMWIPGSRQFRDFEEYLIPPAQFQAQLVQRELGLAVETECEAYLEERMLSLDRAMGRVETLAAKDELPDARMRDRRLKLSPLTNTVPDQAEVLIDRASRLLPRLKITDLLLEVAGVDPFRWREGNFVRCGPSAPLSALSFPFREQAPIGRRPDRRTRLLSQQAGRALRQDGRVKGFAVVRRVEGHTAEPRLPLYAGSTINPETHVRDRVAEAIPVPGPLRMDRLIQVPAARRVDGDKGDPGAVGALRTRKRRPLLRDPLGLSEYILWELRADLQFSPHAPEGLLDGLRNLFSHTLPLGRSRIPLLPAAHPAASTVRVCTFEPFPGTMAVRMLFTPTPTRTIR